MSAGALFLIPAPLSPDRTEQVLSRWACEVLRELDVFVVENAKTARAWLTALHHPTPLRQLTLLECSSPSIQEEIGTLLLAGKSIGLMSDAGCPGVADPGALLVRHAHHLGVKVVPLPGPSSILLALMASGLSGQRFVFHGYLSTDKALRRREIVELEKRSRGREETQIFIETPYRNEAMLDALLDACRPDTLLCVACDLTSQSEWIQTRPVENWRHARPALKNRPAVFLLLAQA